MSLLVFSERFNTIPAPAHSTLLHEYSFSHGRPPARQRLRELSHSLGVSQARIKKWFVERAEREERERRERVAGSVAGMRREREMGELEGVMDGVDSVLERVDSILSSLEKNTTH
jgi:hypothetical protein